MCALSASRSRPQVELEVVLGSFESPQHAPGIGRGRNVEKWLDVQTSLRDGVLVRENKSPHHSAGRQGRAERATGFEPVTSSLGSWHSTPELRPRGYSFSRCPNLARNCSARYSTDSPPRRTSVLQDALGPRAPFRASNQPTPGLFGGTPTPCWS